MQHANKILIFKKKKYLKKKNYIHQKSCVIDTEECKWLKSQDMKADSLM